MHNPPEQNIFPNGYSHKTKSLFFYIITCTFYQSFSIEQIIFIGANQAHYATILNILNVLNILRQYSRVIQTNVYG